MKFRANWRIEQDKWLPILKKWASLTAEQRADVGSGVKLIGRWHDTGARTGVAIFEATDAIALSRYLARWNPFMDIDVVLVLDDEESARLAGFTLEDHAT